MKTAFYLFLFGIGFFLCQESAAQTYQFRVLKNQTYSNLIQETPLFDTVVPYDTNIYTQGSYRLFGRRLSDTLYINSYGRILAWNDTDIFMLDINLIRIDFPEANSLVSYAEEGSAGQRILKLQWKNMGHEFYSDARYNLQVWIYEEDETIEYRFGPCQACSFSQVTRLERYLYDFQNLQERFFPKGDPNNPTFHSDSMNWLDSLPEPGTVYRFAYPGLSVQKVQGKELQLYPNPGNGRIKLGIDKWMSIEVYDNCGRAMQFHLKGDELVLHNAKPGLYFIAAVDESGNTYRAKYQMLSQP